MNRLYEGHSVEEAAEQAVDDCIKDGIMIEFLEKHRAEVIDVILTEYDEQEHMEMERKEWLDIGEERGRAEGKAEAVLELLEDLGEVSGELKRTILAQKDLEVLKRWNKLAAHAGSIEDFQKQMGTARGRQP